MRSQDRAVPVVDLFAGPGGLGEGFAVLGRKEGKPVFSVRLSIEKDTMAHQTVTLRSFFRQFPHGEALEVYYQLARDSVSTTPRRNVEVGQAEGGRDCSRFLDNQCVSLDAGISQGKPCRGGTEGSLRWARQSSLVAASYDPHRS